MEIDAEIFLAYIITLKSDRSSSIFSFEIQK